MSKYYRVIKENPLWEIDAILENTVNDGCGYSPVQDIWNKHTEEDGTVSEEYLSKHIVEYEPQYFERVYKSETDKLVYLTKEQFKKLYKTFIK